MAQTDFFGTFLDTLKSAGSSGRIENSEKSSKDRPRALENNISKRSDSDLAMINKQSVDNMSSAPTDKILQRLAELERDGKTEVEVSYLVPSAVPSISMLIESISELKKYGVVKMTDDNRIALTMDGKNIAQAIR